MKTLIKTLLILYNIMGSIQASTLTFNPLEYEWNESKYDVIVPKVINDDGNGNIEYEKLLQQAKTFENSELKNLVFIDNSTNPETATTENTWKKVLVQKYGTITAYDNGSCSSFQFDSNGLPLITKVFKSNFVTPYRDAKGNEIFRQKIRKDDNNSDVLLQFYENENENPKFIMDGTKEKQVAYTQSGGNIPLVSYVNNENEVNIRYSQNISIQSAQPSNYDLAYNASGLPIVVNCSGTFLQKSQIENLLSFDSDGNPIFKVLMKQAKTNPHSSPKSPVYVTSEGYMTMNSISNGIANSPVYIQKNTGTSKLSYDTNTITFPNITKALKQNSSEYMEGGKNVYIQTDSNNDTLSFDESGNPVFDTEKKQATTKDGTQLIFVDNSGKATKSSSGAAGPVYIQKHTGNLTYDANGIPMIQPAKFQNGTSYQENWTCFYIQSITDGSLEYDANNGNPVFETIRAQAKTNSWGGNKFLVYATSEGYVTTEAISNGIANSPVYIQKNTGTSKLSYDTNTITFPNITKALKQNSSEYMEGGKNVYIQTDSNNDTLSFDESGNPVFDTEAKQATKSDNVTNVFIDNSGNLTTLGGTTIYIQEISDSSVDLAYDEDGMPLVTKAFTSNRNIYPNAYNTYYRQMYDNEPKFNFDDSGNPVKATGNDDITLKIATTKTGNTVYVISEDKDFSSISISDKVAPILIQQWYPDGDDTYNDSITNLKYDSNNLPVIKKVLNKDGTDYTINGVQVYRQITIYEDNFKFDNDGNPIFLIDNIALATYIKEDNNSYTEVNDLIYDIGELVEIENERGISGNKIIKQKCITDNIQWYDLENYVIKWIIENPTLTNNVSILQNTNFIVKNNYNLLKSISCGKYNLQLFIPKNITLTASNVFSGTLESKYLIFGKLDTNCDGNVVSFNNATNFILAPDGIINIPNTATNDFFSGSNQFLVPVIYPKSTWNDFIFTGEEDTNWKYPYYDNGNSTIKKSSYHTFGTGGVLYLNRFTNNDNDKEEAKKISGTIQYGMNIVFPTFMSDSDLKSTKVDNCAYAYTEFFPNLLWYVESGGGKGKLLEIPMTLQEMQRNGGINAKYAFQSVYRIKTRLWDVDFVPDNINRNVLNNTTVENPFLQYDEKYYKGTIEDSITEGEKPEYNGQSDYNPSENRTNKYWDTSTVNNLFSNGNDLDKNGTVGDNITNNLPGELNVGLIDEDGTHNVSTTNGSLIGNNTIQLNGDNKYYNGTYTVPTNTTQVNLNNKTAILKINKEEGTLSGLTYNAMTGIDWEINRTGDDVVSADATKATLPMNIINEKIDDSNYAIITFTDKNNTVNEIEFTGDNTGYTGYVILPETVTTVRFTNGVTTNNVNNAVLKILTGTAKACITTIDDNNIIIKKYEDKVNLSSVNKIVNGGTIYVKQDDGSWYQSIPNDGSWGSSIPSDLNTALFEEQNSSEIYDKRDNIRVLNATYQYNKFTYYFNTATEGNINKIDTCFEGTSHDNNDSNASKNMPTVINTGLINNGDIKIVNNDIENNTTVEFNGKNNGHESGNNIGTPFVGTVTIPVNQNIDTIQFGNNSFIANIVKENKEPYTNLNYFFEKDTVNTIKKFPVNEDNEFDNTKTAEKLSLNLLTMDIGHYDSSNTTGNTTIENTNINVKTFKVRKGMTVTLQSGSHISVRTPV